MKGLIVFLLMLTMGYLIGSFIAWDINPGQWDPIGRAFTAVLSFLVAVLCAAYYVTDTEHNS